MALNGFSEEQIKEAGWVVQSVSGASSYIYSTDYDTDRFKQELNKMVEHIKKSNR